MFDMLVPTGIYIDYIAFDVIHVKLQFPELKYNIESCALLNVSFYLSYIVNFSIAKIKM